MMPISDAKDAYIKAFDSKAYLEEFFSNLDDEFFFTIRFMVDVVRRLPAGLLALEFGGGPALHSVATLTPKSREIHFCDYVPSNIEQVNAWLTKRVDAFDWQPHLRAVLEAEGQVVTPQAIRDRADEIRQKVSRVTICDAFRKTSLGRLNPLYDLVVAHHCTDVAAGTVAEWVEIMGNLGNLVRCGGWLIVSVTTGTTVNTVGPEVFPCVDLSDDDIYRGFRAAGFDERSVRMEKIEVPPDREYRGAASIIAHKL